MKKIFLILIMLITSCEKARPKESKQKTQKVKKVYFNFQPRKGQSTNSPFEMKPNQKSTYLFSRNKDGKNLPNIKILYSYIGAIDVEETFENANNALKGDLFVIRVTKFEEQKTLFSKTFYFTYRGGKEEVFNIENMKLTISNDKN